MRKHPFITEGMGPDDQHIVYVREVREGELPPQANLPTGGDAKIYAIHDASGARLALTDDRKLAFQLARQHDRTPVYVQ